MEESIDGFERVRLKYLWLFTILPPPLPPFYMLCHFASLDNNALMLLLLSIGDREGLETLATQAEEKGSNNLAFATWLQLGNTEACTNLLIKTERAPEAALFARTYAPR